MKGKCNGNKKYRDALGDDAVEGRALEVEGLAALADALLTCFVIREEFAVEDTKREKDEQKRGKREAKKQTKTSTIKEQTIDRFPPQNSLSLSSNLSPVQRARKFSAVLGTTSARSCTSEWCIEKKGEKVSAEEEAREEQSRRERDCWPWDRFVAKKKSFILSPSQTTHRHLDAAKRGTVGGNVKEDDGVGHFEELEEGEKEEEGGVLGDGFLEIVNESVSFFFISLFPSLSLSQEEKEKRPEKKSSRGRNQ